MSGLINEMVVHSDGNDNLKSALSIAMKWHSRATHYSVTISPEGREILHLYWRDGATGENGELPFPLCDLETALHFTSAWLRDPTRAYGQKSNGDGTDIRGWILEAGVKFYEVCRVTAAYNYYGK